MAVGRRGLFVLGASTLLGACAVKPPPENAAPSEIDTPQPVETSSTPSSTPTRTETPAPSETPKAPPAETMTPDPKPSPPPATEPADGTNHNAAATAYAVPAATVHQWISTRTGPQAPTAFLTFDDGPSTLTPQFLDALKQLGVPVTFFVMGRVLEQNAASAKRAMSEGHAICLHSFSHNYDYLYPGRVGNAANIATDYDRALATAKKVFGPTFATSGYRYPGGHMSWTGLAAADAALAQRGASWIDWNCMSGDADRLAPKNADEAVSILTKTFNESKSPSAAVMLNHDSYKAHLTLEGLPRFVQFFRDRGYTFSVIS